MTKAITIRTAAMIFMMILLFLNLDMLKGIIAQNHGNQRPNFQARGLVDQHYVADLSCYLRSADQRADLRHHGNLPVLHSACFVYPASRSLPPLIRHLGWGFELDDDQASIRGETHPLDFYILGLFSC